MLVLDEPTSSLGRDDVEQLFALLRRLKAQGHAIVYISHFIEEVKTIADRFVVLRDGRNAGGGATAGATHDAIVGADGRRPRRAISSRARRARAGEAILVEAGSLEPGVASFTLHRGEILGIAGLVGAGRTRLLRTLFGLEPVQARHACASASSAADRCAPIRAGAGRPAWDCSARTARAKGSRSA